MPQIEYNGEIIEYEIEKKKIKNLYIQVKNGKVNVKIPYTVSIKKVEQFVNKKAKWIYTKLKQEKPSQKMSEEERKYYIEKAKNTYPKIIEKLTLKTGLKPKSWRIRDIKYAWGSCSSKGNITLSLSLIKEPNEVIEYVVLHELCHLKYMNHSKDFWNLVENYMPEYKTYRLELKRNK